MVKAKNTKKKGSKKKTKKVEKTPEQIRKERREFANKSVEKAKGFAALVREKFGKYIRTVLVSGSVSRSDFVGGSDVDVYVIFDDTASDKPFTPEMRDGLFNQLSELALKFGTHPHVHVQLATVTEFIDGIRTANPIIFNFVRNGTAILDTGFFEPLKRMLYLGLIKPGRDTVVQTLEASTEYLNKVRTYYEWSVERMYKSVTWACNSFLMAVGEPPVPVDSLPDALRRLISKQLVEPEYAKTLEDVINLQQDLSNGSVDLKFETVAEVYERAQAFVDRMEEGVKDFFSGKLRADALKDKVTTQPKVFWLNNDGTRGYAWLFEDCVIAALYSKTKQVILKSVIKNKDLDSFIEVDAKELFARLESTEFKPIITPDIILMIINAISREHPTNIKEIGIEYPGRALLDLSEIIIPKKA